uniref:NADH dehydrogenase subunit 2 n=1 Tax=Dactylogyrus lamellatus TaxID=231327 RepID=A0A342K3V6_9PLAT|nr:NADH dehydrogenase subunit 2 [Dactylogyrus lamellatus]ALP29100.1 NADH dehydrogenase subunit 2 [Dactylogyrus lamellatus]
MLSIFIIILSSFLYVSSIFWSSLLGFWVCIEVASLVFLVAFFSLERSGFNRFLGILLYLLMSGVGSGFLYSGGLVDGPDTLLYISFCLKGGIFPFFYWLIPVFNCCSWLMLWLVSVQSKVTNLYLATLGYWGGLGSFFILTFLMMAVYIWSSNFGIKSFLVYSGISSTTILLVVCSAGDIFSSLWLYICYFFVYTINLAVFYILDNKRLQVKQTPLLIFLLVAIPVSLMFIYKIACVICVLGVSLLIVIPWCIFSVVEQLYLVIYCLEKISSFKV